MKHLKNQDMSYIEHLKFAWCISGKLFILTIAGFIHGLMPWFFQSWVSSGIYKINKKMEFDGI